nr:12429_t:CDS:2 [Entrophospora candida]CAG8474398.1 14186_t:CDS:2 [Entrophospora candida]
MKLTPELIECSSSYINTVKDRELNLRGNKIPSIENLGVSKDLNDTIDLTDNDIRILGNFPLLRRVHTLLLANNRINRLDLQLFEFLPNLTTLVLTNNNITELSDLQPLSGFKRLQYISLLDNPVTRKQWYRSWVIWKIPSVRVIDFKRVRDMERKEAKKLFETTKGEPTTLAKSISETTIEPGEGVVSSATTTNINLPKSNLPTIGMSTEEQAQIKEAIRNAKTLEEVARLEKLLQSGHIPSSNKPPSANNDAKQSGNDDGGDEEGDGNEMKE